MKQKLIQILGASIALTFSNATIAYGEKLANNDSFSSKDLILDSLELAQSSEPNIIKPAQQSIPDTTELNPNPDPLSRPTQANEVEVDPQKPITLQQAIALSLNNNRDVETARIQIEQSTAALREARAGLYPNLDFGSGLNYGDELFLDSVVEQAADRNLGTNLTDSTSANFEFNTDLTLGYDIYDGGFRGANIRSAEKELKTDELNLEVVIEQTRFETARDYYSLQNSDAQVEIEKAAVADATQTLRDAELLEEAGLGTRFDVLRAEVELAQARQRLNTAIANQSIARRQLAETLSIDHNSDLATADAIEEAGTWSLSLPESIIRAFSNRAELEQFLLQREISAAQRQIALSQIRPTISAAASYGVDDDFEDSFDISDRYTVGVSLQWRLFDGGAASAEARQAEKEIAIAETQFADQRNQIRFAVEQAYFGLESNQKNIGTATKEQELAEESLRLARLRFQAGVGTQTDVIEAQTDLTTARGNLLDSIINYNQSLIDLKRQVSRVPNAGF
ncbi:MAG: TolC family protein [Cyanobacteria bacterium J06635_13]